MHYLLFYNYVADYLERREAFRDEHLGLAWEYQQRGALILGGVVADPVDGAVLMFKADSPELIEAFVKSDPYVKNGLVTSWKIRPWTTVVGEDAITPVRPG
ncbi:MAG: YciI family protein [Gammaproteobacteria bacterium]|nr:YciI family protein [Gammaproteobacteria bacterium]